MVIRYNYKNDLGHKDLKDNFGKELKGELETEFSF